MPLYEYQCDKCGNSFEVMQKFADQPLTVHDTCGGHLRKLLSAPAFHLKGSGWYITDYGKGGKLPKGDNGNAAKPDSSKSDTKADTPAAKTESTQPVTTTPSTSSDTK
jgi:putative FmdB family regulatory protein